MDCKSLSMVLGTPITGIPFSRAKRWAISRLPSPELLSTTISSYSSRGWANPETVNLGVWGLPAIADFDGDGDIDLFGLHQGIGKGVWFNDGTGLFSSRNAVSTDCYFQNLHSVDLEGDGDQDVLCASGTATNYYLRNKGNGTFETQVAAFGSSGTSTIITADVDGDGDQDVLVGNGDGGENPVVNIQNYLYKKWN